MASFHNGGLSYAMFILWRTQCSIKAMKISQYLNTASIADQKSSLKIVPYLWKLLKQNILLALSFKSIISFLEQG